MNSFLYTIPKVDSNKQNILVDDLQITKILNKNIYNWEYSVKDSIHKGEYFFCNKNKFFYHDVKLYIDEFCFEVNDQYIIFSDEDTDIIKKFNWQNNFFIWDIYILIVKDNIFSVFKNDITPIFMFDNNIIKHEIKNFGIPLCMKIFDIEVFAKDDDADDANSAINFTFNNKAIQFNNFIIKNKMYHDVSIDYQINDIQITILKKITKERTNIILVLEKYPITFYVEKKYLTIQNSLNYSRFTFEEVCNKMVVEYQPTLLDIINYVIKNINNFTL